MISRPGDGACFCAVVDVIGCAASSTAGSCGCRERMAQAGKSESAAPLHISDTHKRGFAYRPECMPLTIQPPPSHASAQCGQMLQSGEIGDGVTQAIRGRFMLPRWNSFIYALRKRVLFTGTRTHERHIWRGVN